MELIVKKTYYPESTIRRSDGRPLRTIPEHTDYYYIYAGKEIAFYAGKEGILYLNHSYINRNNTLSYPIRALTGHCSEAYKELFLLRNPETTVFSEYSNL
jgi:hypothetical protein